MRSSLRLLAIALLLVASPLSAADLSIHQLEASTAGERISVSFRLNGAFDRKEVLRELQSGLPTVFTYDVELIRNRPNWFDSTLDQSRIEVIATFNSVTREYLLNYRRDRKLVRSEIIREFDDLKEKMTTIQEKDLFAVGDRRPWKMVVRVRAEVVQELFFYIVPRMVSTPWEAVRVDTSRLSR